MVETTSGVGPELLWTDSETHALSCFVCHSSSSVHGAAHTLHKQHAALISAIKYCKHSQLLSEYSYCCMQLLVIRHSVVKLNEITVRQRSDQVTCKSCSEADSLLHQISESILSNLTLWNCSRVANGDVWAHWLHERRSTTQLEREVRRPPGWMPVNFKHTNEWDLRPYVVVAAGPS